MNCRVHIIPQLINLHLNPKVAREILKKNNLFFIVGMGRSGTTFLSSLLNNCTDVAVFHETKGDKNALVDSFEYPEKAEAYISGAREKLIAERIIKKKCRVYGEVNSCLRHHVDAMQSRWNPTILHIVRDGRIAVRSIMNRFSFTDRDKHHTGRLRPKKEDPFFNNWHIMSRFERVCWYWAYTNQYLMDRKLLLIRFEDIIISYDYFTKQVLIPLGIDISYKLWKYSISFPQNKTINNEFPDYNDWDRKQQKQFREICGQVMHELGYEI